ncbi:MAG: hypothetical protein HXX08_03630 [Chloroflexi bacterium]|uniref:Uncharacterized protein n=1 Tax=Candidatus Chlorohelix allophototropha TaxID=3003348 RepID=A0A8T7LSF6_9CHLR|nr:hypothetical protein [Chloroflexota bacterium]WJW66829.1 hypothetical protein OZ401_000074 [Chloroflexota bacterium L227-S17]
MLQLPPTLPQFFALVFLAAIAAFLGELIAGAAPDFGFFGAIILAVFGVVILIELPLPQFDFEPTIEDIPIVRGVLGGIFLVAGFGFYRKRRSR